MRSKRNLAISNLIFENAILIAVLGTVISALIALAGFQLSQVRLLVGAILSAAMTIALVVISLMVETDREQIRTTMHEIAQVVRENNHEKLFTYFHPNASDGVQHAKSEVPRYSFEQASVASIRKMIINSRTRPPTAITEFIASFKVSSSDPQTYGAEFNAKRFVKVYWMKENDRWLVQDYEHFDFMKGYAKTAGQ